jgi:hypothetical protein
VTNNTIGKLIQVKPSHNKYFLSVIYQTNCQESPKLYIGQTSGMIPTRCREYINVIRNNNSTSSNHAVHIMKTNLIMTHQKTLLKNSTYATSAGETYT